MKLVKFAFYLAILIGLTKNGYSADPAPKTQTEPGENADEDFPGSLDVKPAPLRAIAEAFLTKRRTVGERMSYDVRSSDACVKEVETVVRNRKVYKHYVCNSHSILCTNSAGYLNGECEPTGYTYITALKKVVSGCRCKAD